MSVRSWMRRGTDKFWRRFWIPFLIFLVCAFTSQRLLRDEPFRTLAVFASGLVALVISIFVNRRFDRREKEDQS